MRETGVKQVYVIPGGRVVHLTTVCDYMRRARGKYEQKSLLEAKIAAKGEPKVCSLCEDIVAKAAGRR